MSVDAVDLVILALRLVLVALLYLFLAAVLRMAAGGLRAPRATDAKPSPQAGLRLVVVEPARSSLRAGQVVEIDAGSTLGRAQRANVVVADPSVSAEHARVDRVGRAWVVTDLGSTNGTRVNAARVSGKTPLTNGDVLELGAVRMQVLAR